MSVMTTRMARELKLLAETPPPGVHACPVQDRTDELIAQIQGPQGTVYENGLFNLSVSIPQRFPFEPPLVRFTTPVYHPNVDTAGRICLDLLLMPPKGAWRPALTISTVLASIGLLLAQPNPDDGLMTDVAAEFKLNRALFDAKARRMTEQHAVAASAAVAAAEPAPAAAASSPPEQASAMQVDAGRSSSEPASSSSGPQTPAGRDKENADANGSGLDLGSREPARKSRLCLGKRLRTA